MFGVHGAVRVDEREAPVGGVRAREGVRLDAFGVVGEVLKDARGAFDHFRGAIPFLNNDTWHHSKEFRKICDLVDIDPRKCARVGVFLKKPRTVRTTGAIKEGTGRDHTFHSYTPSSSFLVFQRKKKRDGV